MAESVTLRQAAPVRWAKVVDQTRCIGCHACSTACKSENQVPIGVHRTYVKYVDVGRFPQARRAFQVTRCNQCAEPPCVYACPTAAMYQRPDGIVDFDKRVCIGCKACIAACPYDAVFINPDDHSAEKCNFCAQRLDVGLEPACVVVCPTEAIVVGDLNDGTSRVSETVGRDTVAVRRPEKGTRPKLFYKGAHQATLDPIAARRPQGGIFMWSEQGSGPQQVTSGHPGAPNNAAAAILAYDVAHQAPWDFRVSLYTWTKGVAAGAYLIPALLLLGGVLQPESALWRWAAPMLGGGVPRGDRRAADPRSHASRALLPGADAPAVAQLARARRHHPVALRCHAGAALRGVARRRDRVAAGARMGGAAARGAVRGLHRLALRAGEGARPVAEPTPAAAASGAGRGLGRRRAPARGHVRRASGDPASGGPITALATLVHLLLVAGEATITHATAHARLAAREMARGRHRRYFRTGIALQAAGLLGALASRRACW